MTRARTVSPCAAAASPEARTRRGRLARGQNQRGGTIADRAGIRRRHRAALAKGRFQLRDPVGARLGGLLVGGNDRLAGAGADRDRCYLRGEGPRGLRVKRASQRGQRIGVLRLPGELVSFGAILGETAHETPRVIGILEPVEEHVIDHLRVPDPRATAHFG